MTRRVLIGAAWLTVFFTAAWVAPDEPHGAAASGRNLAFASRSDLVQGKPVQWWARRAVQARKDANARRRRIHELRLELRRDPTIQEAIALAAVAYRVSSSTLARKASCESTGGHGYNPRAHNASGAAGLFQFLPSTWRTTPFASFSPYDPLAAALAAGWMHAQHRGGEWVCR